MATIHNAQRVLGIRLVADGVTMFNGTPTIGVVDATGQTFNGNLRVLGVAVLPADAAMYNEQPVKGAVLIANGRKLYNNQLVVPVNAVSGVLA